MVVDEDVSCEVLPGVIWHFSLKHRLDCLPGLMLGANLAKINIISNVHIYSGLVDGGLRQVSHLLYASAIVAKLTECSLIQLRGMHTLSPL